MSPEEYVITKRRDFGQQKPIENAHEADGSTTTAKISSRVLSSHSSLFSPDGFEMIALELKERNRGSNKRR